MSKPALAIICICLASATVFGQTRFDEIRETGILYGGIVAEDNYPFVYEREGEWVGYEIDLLQEAADVLGVSLTVETFPNGTALESAIADFEIDLAFSKLLRDHRRSETSFQTVPVAELGVVIVVNRVAYGRMRTSGDLLRDIASGLFAVWIPDDPVFRRELLRKYPNIRLEQMPAGSDMWCCIERGEHVAVALDSASVYYYFARFPERGITLRVIPVDAQATVVGLVPWKDERFWEWMNILIEAQGNPATLNALSTRFPTGYEPRSNQ